MGGTRPDGVVLDQVRPVACRYVIARRIDHRERTDLMGKGDEILVAGEARHLQEQWLLAHPDVKAAPLVQVVDLHGRPRYHPLWIGNPRIAPPGRFFPKDHRPLIVKSAARCRPYIDYDRMKADFGRAFPSRTYDVRYKHKKTPWRFTDHKCKRGELFTRRLRKRPIVIIEPHCKIGVSPNRAWGWDNYQAVVNAIDVDWVQINEQGAPLLNGVRHKPADTFTRACELLSGSWAYFGPEGGLYHAAAALGVPAVAIFGGFVSPANQGYDEPAYVNLYEGMDGESPCGQRVPCGHCTKAMRQITPDMVIPKIEWVLNLCK